MLDLSYIIQDMTTDINTKASEFKIIEDSKDEPDLKAAQKFVGGYVQGIEFPNGDYLIINEEGKLIGLPLNPEATTCLLYTSPSPRDVEESRMPSSA